MASFVKSHDLSQTLRFPFAAFLKRKNTRYLDFSKDIFTSLLKDLLSESENLLCHQQAIAQNFQSCYFCSCCSFAYFSCSCCFFSCSCCYFCCSCCWLLLLIATLELKLVLVLRLAPLFSISTPVLQFTEQLRFCDKGPAEFELIEDVELSVELVLV